MNPWKSNRNQTTYSQVVAQVSEHEVIQAAEETVGTAWMAELREAEAEAATAHRVCTHMRDTAYEIYRSAKDGQDSTQLTESCLELAASQQALGRIRDRQDSLRRFAERERDAWVEAERVRALEVLADRDRLAEAARAAGLKEEGRVDEQR